MTKNVPTVIDAGVIFSTVAPRRNKVSPICSQRDFPSVLIHMRAGDVSLRCIGKSDFHSDWVNVDLLPFSKPIRFSPGST